MKYPGLKCLFLSLAVSLSFFVAVAQTTLPDSLQSAIDQPHLNDKEKSALLTRLAEIYRITNNYQAAIKKARQGVGIALKIHDLAGATKAYTVLANVYANTHQFALLKRTSDTTLSISRQAHNSTAMAYGYYTQALLYNAIDNDETVIKYCLMGIKEAEQIPDPYITAKAYYLLYVLNSNWNNVRKVNTYAQEATRNALHAGDYNLLSNCYVALSVAAEYNYNALKSNDRRDSIIYYLKKVEAIYRQHPKEVAPKTYAIACINIANYYFNYFPETDKVARINAIQYANLTQTVMKHAINGEEIFASSLGLLSEYAKREKNYQLAEMYLLEAYSMMSAQQSPYYYTLVNVISSLAKLYEQTGNYPEALKFQKKVAAYNTKLFDQKQALSAQKLEIQYETEKKNQEVQILREREQYSRIQRYLYIGITMVSLLGLVFMFRSYHFKLRYSLQREKQLHLEKQETELLMKLEKEEQSRLKAEQQLLEAQQLQLQKEMMANQLQLEHKKDVLSQIKEKLHDNPLNINKIWNEELMLDNDFEDAKLQIQQVHPNFFYLLNGMTQQKLTSLDLKHCAYLHLKMDTKKIAAILHIEPKSVRMSRYRIKQKLGLSKEDDLNLFLQNLA